METLSEQNYFAAMPLAELAPEVMMRVDSCRSMYENSGYMALLRRSYSYYFGISETGEYHATSEIASGGEQGEFSLLRVNHYRNLIQHLMVLIAGDRPGLNPEAVNSTARAMNDAKLARAILEYYMYEKKLYEKFRLCVEFALVMGEGFLVQGWDPQAGEAVDIQDGNVVFSGDVWSTVCSPLDVFRDTEEESADGEWMVIQRWVNRWNRVSQYPGLRDDILALPTKEQLLPRYVGQHTQADRPTELIPEYYFYHHRTPALPSGRFAHILSDKVGLYAGPLPTRRVPIYRMAAGNLFGTPYGYSPGFDLLGPQQAINSIYSTILTNQANFGASCVIGKRGMNLDFANLANGSIYVEADDPRNDVQSLNLTSTAPESFEFLKTLENKLETLSAVSALTRGDIPDRTSGPVMAAAQSTTIKHASSLQHSYIDLQENALTDLLEILRTHCEENRLVAISGKYNRAEVKTFKGVDLDNIVRVRVKTGDPVMRTVAQTWLEAGRISLEEYTQLTSTGAVDQVLDPAGSEMILIAAENESMMDGKPVPGLITDKHLLHARHHLGQLNDPEIRGNEQLANVFLDHAMWHLTTVKQMAAADPLLFSMTGQSPIDIQEQFAQVAGAMQQQAQQTQQGAKPPPKEKEAPGPAPTKESK